MWRRIRPDQAERVTLAFLVVLTAATVVGMCEWPDVIPFTILYVPLLLGTATLRPRGVTALTVLIGIATVVAVWTLPNHQPRSYVSVAVLAGMCLAVFVISISRSPIGLGNRRRESMLVDLRDRIVAQGAIPPLPSGWVVESALSSAGGSPFAGDFVVATLREHGTRLELAIVDVSGKGEAAGTRALQLSGAMGGLLAALPPSRFLEDANEYLNQREWEEGFATAAHVSVDLATGDFELRAAGHPPAVQRRSGSGRWEVLRSSGTVLGIVEDVEVECRRGRLLPGDGLLLYTDGMVEVPGRDIELGIDAMMGVAESLQRKGWAGLAERLVAAVGSPDDDRALIAIHRL